MSDNKVIVVAYPVGRVGSSAMMGLLKIAGVSVGDPARMSTAAAMNPKGFFELKAQQQLLAALYPGIYPDVVMPPRLSILDEIGEQGSDQYARLIENEFSTFPIALKSQRFLTLPLLARLRSKYAVKVLVMSRKEHDMVRSIKRVWEIFGNAMQKSASEEFILTWLRAWGRLGKEMREHYPFEYYDVDFDVLLQDPFRGMAQITTFLEISCPAAREIADWLDVRLVNRNALQ